MPLNTLKDLFVEQLNGLHSAEGHNLHMLPKMAEAASSPQLEKLFHSQASQAKEHVAKLNGVFMELGIKPRRIETKGMQGLFEDCMKLANMKRAEPHVRDAALVAAAQHVIHDEIAGYGCAQTWANLLGHEAAATQLQGALIEERNADMELTTIAEALNSRALKPVAA